MTDSKPENSNSSSGSGEATSVRGGTGRTAFEQWRVSQPWFTITKPDADIGLDDDSVHRIANIAASEAWAEATRLAAAPSAPADKAEAVAWLCEFVREDDTTDTQVVLEDPECTRWADSADGDGVSPYRVTPLFASPPAALLREVLSVLKIWEDYDGQRLPAGELARFNAATSAALAKLREQLGEQG